MVLSQLKSELETLESLEFKTVTDEQRKMLRDNFNTYVSFDYAVDDWGNIIFICSDEGFYKLEYYMGLEYVRDCIEYKFSINNKIIVSYSDSERVENLLERLQENEGEEE